MGGPVLSILAVDDDPIALTLYESILSDEGFRVLCASGGRQALDLLAQEPVSLVILDLLMDDMDGLEVLAELRKVWGAARLPVIIVSSNYDAPPMIQALELGANDYLTKPVPPALLLTKIRRYLPKPAPPRPEELGPGSRAGHYEILSLLGEGSMGRVYKARDVRLLRPVAIKVLTRWQEEAQLERFGREALAVARISHPNVVTIYDIGDRPLPFLAMEFLEGDTLDRIAMPLEIPQAVSWTIEFLNALEAVHAVGVIHRDLKPENLMLTRANRLKLMDFGVAQLEVEAVAETIEGTPQYMAPEQIDRAFGPVGPATDIFAMGGILYTLLTGHPPFPCTVPGQQFFTIVFGVPIPPRQIRPEIPPALEAICLKALAKEPPRRYASAAEFASELRSVLPAPW